MSLRISAEMEFELFDSKKYLKALIKKIESEMRIAAGEFAKAALLKIPIRTGFVAGSFGTLQDLVGREAKFNPIISFVRKITGLFTKAPRTIGNGLTEYYYPPGGGKVLKTPKSGRQFATQEADILKRINNRIVFQYEVDITYFNLQDQFPGPSPTAPWQAFEDGELAFLTYMEKTGLLELPAISEFFVKKVLKV